MPIRVSIHSPQKAVPIDRGSIRQLARTVLQNEGVADADISIAFVEDATSRRINRQFLSHDWPTDVITFPLATKPLEAELVIGVEIAVKEARARRHDVDRELALYVIHGLLHLCGYDDKSRRDVRAMRARERFYLRQL